MAIAEAAGGQGGLAAACARLAFVRRMLDVERASALVVYAPLRALYSSLA
jgi:hypothetical protein